ncbi:MAG: serine/threonine protein kinase, partial [Bryobacterales bacterium]|nr:serine/threonine protein kinase [Bryobacterales bacterium]
MRPDEVRPWFEALAGVGAEERAAALDGLRERAPEVAREVARLLQAHDRRGHFLSTPMVVAAGEAERPVETAGAYRVKRVLSQGGMGVVYEAVRADDVFEKRVALKMIRGAAMTSALQERFRVERQILASMEHPNVARILDGGETADGRPYLVMEYVEGRPIDAHAKEKELGLEARLALFLQLCAAVQFAHQHLVVHRDLKPGNIFVTEGGQVKLLDFGIAKIVSEHGEGAAAKTTQLQAMTPEYASPEQISGQPVSTGTDVFLLGIVLYELVAGAHPFGAAGKLPHEVMRSICEEDAPAASMVTRVGWRRRLKGDFDKIAAMALQKEPGRRYASVEALAGDIRRFLTNEPVAAQGDSFGYRAGKFVRRRWAVLAGAAVVFLTMAGAAAISMRAAEEARRQRAIAEARRVEAEEQRGKAEQAAAQAIAERAEAEARKVEAERLRAVADEERARTERHMGAQRALAMNLLTTSDTQFRAGSYKDAIANLESNLKAQSALAAGDPGDKNLQKMIGVLE